MKRPVLIVSGDFVKTGGMDRANYALADYLSRRGDPVELVAHRIGDDLVGRPGLTWHPVPKPLNSYTLGRPLLDREGRRRAATVAGHGGRVIVNGAICRWGDLNWVHHINVLDPPQPVGAPLRRMKAALDHRANVRAERRALGVARQVVTTCLKNRDDLIRQFGITPEAIEVVYYGTDPGIFRPGSSEERRAIRSREGWDPDRPVYLFVGGLGVDRRKGFDTLFGAWSELCRDPGWDADLVVVGDGAERPMWESRVAGSGLAGRVRFLGFRRDVPDLFRAADAHVLPSRYEGYSLVTQEAICSGLPAFVTRTAGIAERFRGNLADALLIDDPDDPATLARLILAWRERSSSLGPELEALATDLRAFTWDDMAARFAEIVSRPGPSIG